MLLRMIPGFCKNPVNKLLERYQNKLIRDPRLKWMISHERMMGLDQENLEFERQKMEGKSKTINH